MKKLINALLILIVFCLTFMMACGEDEGVNTDDENTRPSVVQPIADLNLQEGFGTETINVSNVFFDEDGDALTYSVSSSETSVVTVSNAGPSITLTEAGTGSSSVTVTANDGNGGSVNDTFTVTVNEEVDPIVCTTDYSTNQTRDACDNPAGMLDYTETVNNGMRNVRGSGIPNHDYGNQFQDFPPNDPNADTEVEDKNYNLNFTVSPTLANSTTSILDQNNRPSYTFGVALNSVPIDPAPATPFLFENPETGEDNWDWVFEPNNNTEAVGLDCATAHVQPDGSYHYHGDMGPLAEIYSVGISSGTAPSESVQIGWAADGFPVVYRYGPTSNGNGIELLTPSYRLKSGNRPGDDITEPCGEYNGKFTNDYEYVAGLGDLDECNGIARSITLETEGGGMETFTYFYVITEEFPVISRCFSGTPSQAFAKGM